jgi:hypothetical protein
MTCQCFLALGYLTLAYAAYRLLNAIYSIIYPFFIATPPDLHKIAGGKWAGEVKKIFCFYLLLKNAKCDQRATLRQH